MMTGVGDIVVSNVFRNRIVGHPFSGLINSHGITNYKLHIVFSLVAIKILFNLVEGRISSTKIKIKLHSPERLSNTDSILKTRVCIFL